MDVALIILGVILLIALLTSFSFLGWVFKGIGVVLDVFTEGLGNFFGTIIGCLIKIFVLICILAAIFT